MLTQEKLNEPETYYPLKVFVCHNCFLVQLDEMRKASKIFNDEYTYFSSFSTSWLEHAKQYTNLVTDRFGLDEQSQVIEIGSNDGYLLQYFKEKDIPVLGVDPSASTAQEAERKGISTIVDFFSSDFAKKELIENGIKGDLVVGNNVLAHVPDINDFVKGIKLALAEEGILTMEFPHLLRLVNKTEFDTIYHEHFSYLSLYAVKRIFESQGLEIFDVENLYTHGGSLRIYAKHAQDASKKESEKVKQLLDEELAYGINQLSFYEEFQTKVEQIKYDALSFLIEQKRSGKKIIGYGAAAKGSAFLNYCGVKGTNLIQFVVDASPHKQNKFLPGSHIPVFEKEEIEEYQPDYIIILPWNLKNEISKQLAYTRNWGCRFVIFIPEVTII
jgi:2-polyprenyl-3-methyl-5-hydroxy-6-metoxy-1,4-benzoquinol methylase